ncbi:HAD family phosphatase [Variovorax dokdonensis]|uniref:HAD family phosphatase n=1 Tax=Variovorax dokdonensis TaxID=344883 RepID=A0ABT7NFZ1_9BURK|nr:HAD family phosphatase [Variovorax dokdonensis]MDM0046842.1 HAD family phosphatase [Variovorax dokdonensis]
MNPEPGRSPASLQEFDPAVVRALLFDLGGVVFEFDFAHALAHWAPLSRLSEQELREAFSHDEDYCRHERGELDASAYFDTLRRKLALDATDEQIRVGWNAIFRSEIVQTLDAVQAARAFFPCFAFSNTNTTHHAAFRCAYPRIDHSFDRVFASSDIGMRKPEAAAFAHVCRAIGQPAKSVLFFDDLEENVRGAAACGLQVVHVKSPADVLGALRRLGCLD